MPEGSVLRDNSQRNVESTQIIQGVTFSVNLDEQESTASNLEALLPTPVGVFCSTGG